MYRGHNPFEDENNSRRNKSTIKQSKRNSFAWVSTCATFRLLEMVSFTPKDNRQSKDFFYNNTRNTKDKPRERNNNTNI